jgi:hypothetical protein
MVYICECSSGQGMASTQMLAPVRTPAPVLHALLPTPPAAWNGHIPQEGLVKSLCFWRAPRSQIKRFGNWRDRVYPASTRVVGSMHAAACPTYVPTKASCSYACCCARLRMPVAAMHASAHTHGDRLRLHLLPVLANENTWNGKHLQQHMLETCETFETYSCNICV